MRYINTDIIVFTDKNGKSYQVKDNLPVGVYSTAIIEKINQNTFIDELISRTDFYGDNQESLSYAVVDNNIIKLIESNFDLSNLKSLNIPYIES